MTDQGQEKAVARCDGRIQQIFEKAIAEALSRLDSIKDDERDDNVAFDRAARTALAFLRIAESAAALAARKRKDDTDNEQRGASADDDARIARDEQELKRRLDKYIDGLSGRPAAGDRGRDGAGRGAGEGDRA